MSLIYRILFESYLWNEGQTCEDKNRRFEHETSLSFLFKLVNIRIALSLVYKLVIIS